MGMMVVTGAMMQCSFGVAPSTLVVVDPTKNVTGMPIATIMNNVPMLNIMPFGMCSAPSNPTVIAATAAKLGVFTPMPCIPVTVAPWVPGDPTIIIGTFPALTDSSKLICAWGGVISITFPGQVKVKLA